MSDQVNLFRLSAAGVMFVADLLGLNPEDILSVDVNRDMGFFVTLKARTDLVDASLDVRSDFN